MMSSFLSVSSTLMYIGYIVIAVLVLLAMVTIHEFGHYIAGKMLKFKINEFSVGFGPKLLQKKKKNGEYFSLRLLPLGGYCAFEGENEDGTESPESFNSQKPWKRLIVLFFGAFFNFLSAIIFSFILLISAGYDYVAVKSIDTTSMNSGYFQTGDVIYGIENQEIDFVTDDFFNSLITEAVKAKYGDYATAYVGEDITTEYPFEEDNKTYYMRENFINFNIKRNGEKIVQPAYVNVIYDEDGKYAGWSFMNDNNDETSFAITTYTYTFSEAITQAVPFTCKWVWKTIVVFGQLLTGQLSVTSMGGPVTTIKLMADYTALSYKYLLLLLPIIAVNLAVFNLFPIPALDGCQMIFVIIEWIRKKPVKREVINLVNNIGLIALFGFVIIVDILQFVL